jgi:hypothetical protein
MSLSATPATPIIGTKGERLTPIWQVWFNSIQQWLGPQGQFGTTTKRPTSGLYIGLSYYDQTLGYPVFVHQVTPTIVWHNGAGTPV